MLKDLRGFHLHTNQMQTNGDCLFIIHSVEKEFAKDGVPMEKDLFRVAKENKDGKITFWSETNVMQSGMTEEDWQRYHRRMEEDVSDKNRYIGTIFSYNIRDGV